MDHSAIGGRSAIETDLPTDLVSGLLMEMAHTPAAAATEKLTLKIYGVMAVTTMITFATLTTGYQLLFAHQLFA